MTKLKSRGKRLCGALPLAGLLLVALVPLWAAEPPDAAALKAAGKTAEVYTDWPFDAKEAFRRQADTAKALGVPKETAVDVGGVGLKFVLIPAGKFEDDAKKEVVISKPFYMAVYKVTQAQYERVMGKNPSKHLGSSNPVDTVNWANAAEFCRKASEKSKRHLALPSEAQWECACRAGTATRCYWGDDMSKMGNYCWWHDNCGMTTHPVGQKIPNAFGLYDMMGLLWEWCGDGGAQTENHIVRGATFGSREPMFKSAVRMECGSDANDRYGMRVVMDIE